MSSVPVKNVITKTRSVGTFLKARALFPAPATVEKANKRQHTADGRWRALQREARALPEIGVERNKNSKKY